MVEVLEDLMAQAPAAVTIVMAVAVFVGLLLWLLGRRLAKPAVVVCGAVGGAIAGALVAAGLMADRPVMIGLVTGGSALAGALVASMLFRLWMALSGAVVLALLAPLAVLIWQGTPRVELSEEPAKQEIQEPATDEQSPPKSSLVEDAESPSSLSPDQFIDKDRRDEIVDAAEQGVREAATSIWQRNEAAVRAWWEETDETTRKLLFGGIGMGALAGLIIGLLMPMLMASLQTAAVGSLLILLPGRELIETYAPQWSAWMPSTPEQLALCLGLITLLGVGVQWITRSRRAEKS